MNEPQQDILTEYVELNRDVQEHIWNSERRKTRNKIWFVALVFLGADLLALSMANMMSTTSFLASLVLPVILFGAGCWALINPLPAIIASTVLVLGIFTYQFYIAGWSSLLSGLLLKGVLAGLIISGWKSAREADGARRQLRG